MEPLSTIDDVHRVAGRKQDPELVLPQSSDVTVAGVCQQPLGDLDEQRVGARRAKCVVDLVEVVEVEEEQRCLSVLAGHGRVELALEPEPVRQAGQLVVGRDVVQLVHVPSHARGRSGEHGDEQSAQKQEQHLEDGGDDERRTSGGGLDRAVVPDRAGMTPMVRPPLDRIGRNVFTVRPAGVELTCDTTFPVSAWRTSSRAGSTPARAELVNVIPPLRL